MRDVKVFLIITLIIEDIQAASHLARFLVAPSVAP